MKRRFSGRTEVRRCFWLRILQVPCVILAAAVAAKADVQLLPIDASWRYEQTTNLDGVAWQLTTYDDSTWPTGSALLYVETNPLVSPRNTPLTLGRTTYYFRTHFTLPYDRTNLLLSFSARVDDGAVFYLNGQEIQRLRMDPGPTAIYYTNLATGTPAGGDATASEAFTLSGVDLTNLATGDNLLAVEVHQNATNSDDIVFGSALTVKFTNSPPILVQQPTNVTVLDGRPATLTAIVDGNPTPTLQWFKDDAPLAGVTNASLFFAPAYPNNGGVYRFAATNAFGGLSSSNAVLTVLADTNPPTIYSALAQKNLTNVTVFFSEAILSSSATATNNYEVFQTVSPSNRLAVTSVSPSGSTGVVLRTTARTPGINYSLRVNGVQDVSSVSNQIAADSTVPLTYQVDLIAVDATTTWHYFQLGQQPATNWMAAGYDDSAWSSGAALFSGGTPTPATADPVRTTLSLTNAGNGVQAFYFRTFFDAPGPVDTSSLHLHHVVDDGAVFYLNSTEVFAIGMPVTRPVAYTNAAARTVGTAVYEPSVSASGWVIAGTNLAVPRNSFAAEVHQSAAGFSDVSFGANLDAVITHYNTRPAIYVPAAVVEGSGTLTNQGQLSILEPLETNVVFQLSSGRPADVVVPSQVTILAGMTNTVFDLVMGDDALFNGPRLVTLTATNSDSPAATASLQVLDNETNVIQLSIASLLSETSGVVQASVRFSQPPSQPIAVALASSDTTEITVPSSVTMPAGATAVVFNATCVDDPFVDGPQLVTLSATVAGWPVATTNVIVRDNESSNLVMTLPFSVVEGDGVLSNAASVRLATNAGANFTITLTSSDPSLVGVPTNVVILAGQSNVVFDLVMGDNATIDNLRQVTLTASTPGLISTTNVLNVWDNDAHHIRFSPIGWLQTTGTAFGINLYAEDAGGNLLTGYYGNVSLSATGLEGALPLDMTNSGGFAGGQRFLSVRVTAPGTGVRLYSSPISGVSDVFNVGLPPVYGISQPVADIAWHEASQTLFASVPASGGVYSNQLVAIDPASGAVTNTYPLGDSPGQIEISPNGQFLYATLSNATALRRFDLNTRQAGLVFAVDTNTSPLKTVYDFCILAGTSDSVVMMGWDNYPTSTQLGGVWRFDSGVRIALPNFTGTGGRYLEGLPTASDILLSPPLVKGQATPNSGLTTSPDFAGTLAFYRDGRVYDETGHALSLSALTRLGTYPDVVGVRHDRSLVEVDSGLRRVFYLEGYANYGTIFYKIKTYDRDLFQTLSTFDVPGTAGSPTRLIRWSTNGLAYRTENNLLWFVRPDLIASARPAADLNLSLQALQPTAYVGVDFPVTLTLSNAGPGIASIVRVTNSLPANASVVSSAASTGNVALAKAAVSWYVPALAPGSNATLNLTLRFGNAGWQTNLAWALGFETDPAFTNNFVSFPLYVQLPPDGLGVFALNAASEGILYDPARDRLLLSVGATPSGQSNGIAVLDPYRGVVDSFTTLAKRPTRMARSDDGLQLYVSLPDDALVRRLTMTNLTPNLEFSLGGEYIYSVWYPFYAADMAVMPGNSGSLAAWRVRRAGPMAGEYGWGIAMFDKGVMRSNVTASGGAWQVEFDTNTGTLFGYNGGDLRRCALDVGGVTFAETFPAMTYDIGSDIEFADGQFFTSAGRVLRTQPFGVTGIFPGSEGATLVEPDAASGRVFYLAVTNSTGWLRAFESDSQNPRGLILISNVLGTATSLIRWGTNGLAFRTTSNQLFLVRTPLTQPSADADVRAALSPASASITTNGNALFTLTLTNAGPAASGAVQVTNSFKPSAILVSVTYTNGTCVTNAGNLVWSLNSLATGEKASLSFSLSSSSTGIVTVISSAQSVSPDPIPQNNTAIATMKAGPPADAVYSAVLNLAARDLVWSPTLNRLLLAGAPAQPNGDGALFSLDPQTLEPRWEAQLGAGADRLKLSGDDTRLYASLAYGIEERVIPSLALQRRFLVGKLGGLERATDFGVLPGSPQSLAVLRVAYGFTADVPILDTGVARTNIATSQGDGYGEVLEVGNDPSRVYVQNFGVGGFRRYAVDTQGTTFMDADSSLLPVLNSVDIEWGGGRIFSSIGKVIDPVALTLAGTIPNIASGSLVVYDETAARVFYLSVSGSSATLKAFDGPTLLPVGSVNVSGVSGTASKLVRWGADGFAFLTTGNQVFLFRTSLIPTNPPADIAVSLAQSAAPNISGSNLSATILITNAGPNAATQVVWTNTLPTGATVVNASASAGSLATAANVVSGQLPFLAAGDAATVSVTYKVNSVGVFTNQVFALSSSVDLAFANNTATRLLWIQSPNGLPPVLTLSLPLKDLERDPVRPLLYASLGSNAGPLADSVVTIDPANGDIGAPVRVGSDPGRLAASPDGQFLYVGLDGAGTVQKLALPSLTPVSSFAVPQNQVVSRMVVSPNDHDTVVIRRTPGGQTSLHVGGVERPGELSAQDLFAFAGTNGALFGCDGFHSNVKMYRLDTGASGLRLLGSQPGKQSSSADLKSSGGLLFFDRGMVVNPDTMRVQAIMPVPFNSVVEPDWNSGRVFYLTGTGTTWTLRAFDIAQGIEVGTLPISGLASAPRRLLRWGADGLALYTANSQLVLLRGLLVPTNSPADIVLRQSVNALTATTNDSLSFVLQLSNRGPATAASVIVTQVFSLSVTNVLLATTNGSASATNGTVVWQAGNVATGSVATLNATVRALQAGTLNASAGAYHNQNDSFWGDNAALNAANILPTSSSNVLQLRLGTRELVYDPSRDLIYATTPASNQLTGNLIVGLNPATGEMVRVLAAGSEPNQLAISSDAGFLHVSLDGTTGAKRFSLQMAAADRDFSFGTNDIYFAQDIAAQPGQPDTVAASLGSYNFATGYPSDVWIYDAGVARAAKGTEASGLVFSADGAQLFGYASPSISYGFVRMTVGAQGILGRDSFSLFSSQSSEVKFRNGRLYSSTGQVVDPFAPVLIGSFGATGPLTVDETVGRVFYLAQSGTNWEVRAFSLATLQATGTQTVASVQGTPGNLIRCGADRLAFRTSSNQVFILKSPLVPAALVTAADLGVTQTAAQDFSAPVDTLRFVMTVTNAGPGAASNVVLAVQPPAPVPSLSLQIPQGTSTNSGGIFLCSLGTVAAGQSLQIVLSAIITNTGSYSNFASVSAAAPDAASSNNTSLASLTGLYFQPTDSVKIYPASVRALAYDPVRRRLFAALLTNQLAWFDPETGVQQGTLPVAIAPTLMRVTDDGQYLYLSANTTGLVQRVHLPSLAVDLSFIANGATSVGTTAIVPGSPHALAASYWNTNGYFTAVFDDGVARSNVAAGRYYQLLAVSSDGTKLFGYDPGGTGGNSPDVFRLNLTPQGLTPLDNGPSDTPWGYNQGMTYSTNRLFFANGDVLNPATWIEEQAFVLPYWGAGLTMIPGTSAVAFLTADYNSQLNAHIPIFAIDGRQLLAQFDLQLTSTSFDNLTHCGADRFAFRTGNALVFVRSSAIPSADVVLRASLATNQIMVSETVSLQLVVSNAGPYSATGVTLTNVLPSGMNLVSATSSQGAVTTNGATVTAVLGSLNTNSAATVTMVLSPTVQALGFATNTAEVAATAPTDAVLFNNRATLAMTILPADTDHDGMPDDWELARGLNPTNAADAALDSDCDGLTNLQEYQAGTDPMQFENLRLLSPRVDAAGRFSARIQAPVGKILTLESSSNLTQWVAQTNFLCRSAGQEISWGAASEPQSFYRLRTDTNAALPLLTLVNASSLATNPPLLQINALPGRICALQSSTDLVHWATVTSYFATSCATLIVDPSPAGYGMRFYRVMTQ